MIAVTTSGSMKAKPGRFLLANTKLTTANGFRVARFSAEQVKWSASDLTNGES